MNERIKELAKGCYVRSSGIEFSNFDYEKFAHRLVKECAKIVEQFHKVDEFSTDNAADNIRKHFGVKE
jgi:hypothetical protein